MNKISFSENEQRLIKIALDHSLQNERAQSTNALSHLSSAQLIALHKVFEELRAECYFLVGEAGREIIDDPGSGFFS